MGMLDDAIREHLELKRLRGADPTDIAREERDALGSVQRTGATPEDAAMASVAGGLTDEAVPDAGDADAQDSSAAHGAGQETVEINMEAELAGDSPAPTPAGDRTAPVGHPAHKQPSSGDSLEWEMPEDRPAGGSGEPANAGERPPDEEPVEDVLEETPDFLRETPEHERLWFEQRPPRDFDFNE